MSKLLNFFIFNTNNYQIQILYLLILIFVVNFSDQFDDVNNNIVKIQKHGLELTQTTNIQREEYMQRMCEVLGYNVNTLDDLPDEQMDHMLIDTKHKFLYCYVPKVACTNWKRVLMIMTGLWKNGTDPLQIPAYVAHSPNMFKKLTSFNPDERKLILSEYTKFIVVRHPFERLLSAYRNKLEGNTASARYFQLRIGKQIISHFRKNPSNDSLEKGDDVTFGEFIQYLLTPNLSLSNQSFNEHWEPASKLCHPCILKYNVIGKYETLIDDSALALYLTEVDQKLTFPTGHKSAQTHSQLRKYFDPIPMGAIRKLYEIYRDDFKLFDYGLDHVLGFEFG